MNKNFNIRFQSKWIFTAIIFVLFTALGVSSEKAQKFYEDDPIWKDPETQDAAGVQPWEINLIYDLTENMFSKPGDPTPNVRAQNVNTVDEVPDSSWFTNRQKLTVQDVSKGPNITNGPTPGKWIVISAKNDGVSPGFTIKDSQDVIWFIKPDPPAYPAMATGSEVIATKLFWALGYNVPENHIARMRYEDLTIGEKTLIKTRSGNKRPMKAEDIKAMLRLAHQELDGSYRVHASKRLEGKILGGIRFFGTRPDDPNDVIPHEHRRELRGYRVFAAWFNHVDSKAINAMDTLEEENGKSFVKHYLLDFSSTFGSGSIYAHDYWEGYEYFFERGGPIVKDIVSFGFRIEPWRTMRVYESPSIGRMQEDNTKWNPDKWVPRIPNAAFLRARADDKFWAARKAMAITDDMIRAAVQAGQLGDEKSEEFLIRALIERRDAIGQKYLLGINPIVDPVLDASGVLTFKNAAVSAGFAKPPEGYQAVWYSFDNGTGQTTLIGRTGGSAEKLSAPAGLPSGSDAYIKLELSATRSDYPSWQTPIHVYFHKTADGWKLVGLERMPEGSTGTSASKKS